MYNEYVSNKRSRKTKTLIVQRATEKFWKVIFSQRFDLSKQNLFIRFASEAASDAGGLYREFLTLTMKRLPQLSNVFFGGLHICFSSNTEPVLNNIYFKLGQLCAVAIITIGRGPEIFHPAITRALFDVEQPEHIESIEDAEIQLNLKKIEQGDVDVLYDHNIVPVGKSIKELKKLFLISSVTSLH